MHDHFCDGRGKQEAVSLISVLGRSLSSSLRLQLNDKLTSHGSYEVQDPEPDENGAPGSIYKASAQALIAIPTPDTALPDYQVGKFVLARYPETTTFYRAEVMGLSKDTYRLKFEDDQNQELEVDRRYVLDFGNR